MRITWSEGLVVADGGQLYRCERIEPYTRKDGGASAIAIIASDCAKCGEPFTQTQALVVREGNLNRRCKAHRRPSSRVRRPKSRKGPAKVPHEVPQTQDRGGAGPDPYRKIVGVPHRQVPHAGLRSRKNDDAAITPEEMMDCYQFGKVE